MDQGAERFAHQGGPLHCAGEALRFCEQVIIEDESRTHLNPFLGIRLVI